MAELVVQVVEDRLEPGEGSRVVVVAGHVAAELDDLLPAWHVGHRLHHEVPEALVVEGRAGHSDDRERGGQQPAPAQAAQGGQQLPLGQVPGRPEDDQHARWRPPGGLDPLGQGIRAAVRTSLMQV